MKKISINKIAELAGVSKTTVSFVLNGRGDEKHISSKTQERIIDIAKAVATAPIHIPIFQNLSYLSESPNPFLLSQNSYFSATQNPSRQT